MIFKRPWPLLILVVLLVFFTLFQFIRFGETLAWWSFLDSLTMRVPPFYLALTGLVWGIFGEVAVYRVWMGKPKARQTVRNLTLAYAVVYWLEQFFLMVDPLRKTSWAFSAIATVFMGLLIFSILAQDSVRQFFGEPYD